MSNKKTQNQWSQQKPQVSQVSQVKSHVTEPFTKQLGEVMNEGGFQKSVQSQLSPEKNQISESYFTPKMFGDMVLNQISAKGKDRVQNAAEAESEYEKILPPLYAELVMFTFDRRMTLKSFKKLALKANKQLSTEFLNGLFRMIDCSSKGSVFFNELFNFYLEHTRDTEMM